MVAWWHGGMSMTWWHEQERVEQDYVSKLTAGASSPHPLSLIFSSYLLPVPHPKPYQMCFSTVQERVEQDYVSRLTAALTRVRGINRTDAVVLGSQFGSLADILRAGKEELSGCPGIGPTKASWLGWGRCENIRFQVPAQVGTVGT
jgi:hypothetical protein